MEEQVHTITVKTRLYENDSRIYTLAFTGPMTDETLRWVRKAIDNIDKGKRRFTCPKYVPRAVSDFVYDVASNPLRPLISLSLD